MTHDVALIGLGIVGGSLARALAERAPGIRVHGVDPDQAALGAASEAGVITSAAPGPSPKLSECDLVVVCTPLSAVPSVFKAISGHLCAESLVTDVVGLKTPVARWAAQHLSNDFIGGHPMAGGALQGFAASRADLFDGAPVALCPPVGDVCASRCEQLAQWWRRLGARPLVTTAEDHDRWAAEISHLPYAVAVTLLDRASDDALRLAGRGFDRATHYAGFDPEVMSTVAGHNTHLATLLRDLARDLEALATQLELDPDALRERATRVRGRHATSVQGD